MQGELDFSGRNVLVVGGSSGIGNGIAQAFLGHGARVHVCGTRASAADYAGTAGSDLAGLSYTQLDVSDIGAIESWTPPFERLDVLEDRRAWRIRLTLKGRNTFRDMAQQHEAWIVSAFDNLNEKEIQTLYKLLGRVKQHAHSTPETETP